MVVEDHAGESAATCIVYDDSAKPIFKMRHAADIDVARAVVALVNAAPCDRPVPPGRGCKRCGQYTTSVYCSIKCARGGE
jgi:hypothetical protein